MALLRAPPLLAAAATEKLPLPVPEAPLVIVSQLGSPLVAFHEHQLFVVTCTVAVSPAIARVRLPGATLKLQPAAACVTVNAWPPTVTVALRAPPPFAAALTCAVPLPVPDAPSVTVNQVVSLLVVVHVQALPVATAKAAVPPPAAIDWPLGVTEYTQVDWPFNVTESTAAVVVASTLWLVTAIPTNTFAAIGIVVVLPTFVHVTPSTD